MRLCIKCSKNSPLKLEVKERKTKSDHKPISPFEPIFNLLRDTHTSKALNQHEITSELQRLVLEEIRNTLGTKKHQKKKHKKPVHPKSIDVVSLHLKNEIFPSKGRDWLKAMEYRPNEAVNRVLDDGYSAKVIKVDESKIEANLVLACSYKHS